MLGAAHHALTFALAAYCGPPKTASVSGALYLIVALVANASVESASHFYVPLGQNAKKVWLLLFFVSIVSLSVRVYAASISSSDLGGAGQTMGYLAGDSNVSSLAISFCPDTVVFLISLLMIVMRIRHKGDVHAHTPSSPPSPRNPTWTLLCMFGAAATNASILTFGFLAYVCYALIIMAFAPTLQDAVAVVRRACFSKWSRRMLTVYAGACLAGNYVYQFYVQARIRGSSAGIVRCDGSYLNDMNSPIPGIGAFCAIGFVPFVAPALDPTMAVVQTSYALLYFLSIALMPTAGSGSDAMSHLDSNDLTERLIGEQSLSPISQEAYLVLVLSRLTRAWRGTGGRAAMVLASLVWCLTFPSLTGVAPLVWVVYALATLKKSFAGTRYHASNVHLRCAFFLYTIAVLCVKFVGIVMLRGEAFPVKMSRILFMRLGGVFPVFPQIDATNASSSSTNVPIDAMLNLSSIEIFVTFVVVVVTSVCLTRCQATCSCAYFWRKETKVDNASSLDNLRRQCQRPRAHYFIRICVDARGCLPHDLPYILRCYHHISTLSCSLLQSADLL